MKRILLALAITTFILPVAREAQGDVSIDFFYNNLNDGNWVEVADYGYCWQPNITVSNADWRPYADGYWAYTDLGWTWVSYEDFGWATYHYGRWARLTDLGWVWVPGYEWGPAWVSWRTGGDYVGWAPLPPSRQVVYEGRPITGHVDVEFDIGPMYYNFVDIRYIGEPVLRQRIFPATQNVTYITQTVNVTNITYKNATVYNYGPDYNRLSQYSTRPIQRLTLQRQTNVNLAAGVRPNEVTKVEGNTLVVAAPVKIQKPAKAVAPKNVKTKIAQAKLETGWSGISDPSAKAQLQEKMKTEDAQNVPPPKVQATGRATTGAGASPAEGVSPATPEVGATGAGAAGSPSPAAAGARGKARRGEQPAEAAAPTASPAGEEERVAPRERSRARKGRAGEEAAPSPGPRGRKAASPSEVERDTVRGHNQGRPEREETSPTRREAPEQAGRGAGVTPEATEPSSRQRGGRAHREETTPATATPGERSTEAERGRGEERSDMGPGGQPTGAEARGRRNAAQEREAGQPPGGPNVGEKKGGQHKKKGAEASPSPGESP